MKGFRHELASALAVIRNGLPDLVATSWLPTMEKYVSPSVPASKRNRNPMIRTNVLLWNLGKGSLRRLEPLGWVSFLRRFLISAWFR